MITQVSFTTDKNLKEKALQRARQEGITLKTLFVYTMKGFVDGKISLGLEMQAKPHLTELDRNQVSTILKKEAARAKRSKKSDLINI